MCARAAHRSAMPTVTVDSARPANDIAQNGMTSRHRSLVPCWLQVHRRLRWYDGMVASAVVAMFAVIAAMPNVVRVTRLTRLNIVVMTDTDMHRRSRVTSGT